VCGIFGIAGNAAAVSDRREAIDRARDTLTHRGPDDAGTWIAPTGRAALAMRRLAIVDLSPAGHQPMCARASEQDVVLVFNGEIYNHVEIRKELAALGRTFRGRSDTEVVLAAYLEWGIECVSRFVGMFAIAFYDGRSDQLILMRDRAGEKPLFFHHSPGRITFGSELKALLEDERIPRRLDAGALNYYLAYGYVPSRSCLIQGCRKVPSGHVLVYDLASDEMRMWPYWQVPALGTQTDCSTESLLEELEQLLETSVRAQLHADVPVGVMLSGGIDSSLVAALAVRSASDVRTFTVSMPTRDQFDEGPRARRVAAYLGTRHVELQAEPASVELLPMLARQFDEPIADSSMVPTYLLSKLIRDHAKVALGGDGGDELFGGYAHHRWMLQHERIRQLSFGQAGKLVRPFRPLMPLGMRGSNYISALSGDRSQSHARLSLYFDSGWRRKLSPLLGGLSDEAIHEPELYKASLSYHGASPLQRVTAVDFLTYLPADILVKVDRASMLTSLEVRAPWLDHRIIEFAFGRVPDHLRATRQMGKILPKMLAERFLPGVLNLDRKQGFSIPLHAWFKGEWGQFMAEVLSEAPQGLFDRRTVGRLIRNQRLGLSNTHRIFALTMIELWRREYSVMLPGE
jgi:asparagine synthase (glutamine-hydrolysing)